jgi:hypothetical protein
LTDLTLEYPDKNVQNSKKIIKSPFEVPAYKKHAMNMFCTAVMVVTAY